MIVDRILKSLFATQVPLRCLDRDMPEKELYLLQLPAGLVAKTSASPSEIVRRKSRDTKVFLAIEMK